MTDERCRITVVGERRQVDIAVPAHAPISEYAFMLADLCGQDEMDAMPPAWSLAPAGRPPFDPDLSLGAGGVLDGATLYLRDVLDAEFSEPAVADIEEAVDRLDDDGRIWNARARAFTTLALGLLTLVGGAAALGAGGDADGAVAIGAALFATGLTLPVIAWVAARKHWPVPEGLRLALAAMACPLLAAAALTLPLLDAPSALVAASAAALVGAATAYLAAPSAATMLLLLASGPVLPLAVPLVLLGADAAESAGVVAVVAFQLLAVLPRLATQVATMPSGTAEIDDVEDTVRKVERALTLLNLLCCATIVACLAILGVSDDGFASGLALCLGAALLCRAGSSRLTAVVATVLVSGLAGPALLLLRAPDMFPALGLPEWAGTLALLIGGLILLWAGLVLCFRSSLQQVDFGERWPWPGPLGTFLGVLSVPLAAGLFGVWESLLQAGMEI